MGDCLWPELARATLPAAGEVLVVSAPIDLPPERVARLRETLNDEERTRADRFYTAELRSRWTAARGLLRELLAALLHGEASALEFRTLEQGKPELVASSAPSPPDRPLEFNISHSGGRMLFAFARGQRVGVDLEHIHPRHLEGIADRFFAPEESAALRSLEDEAEQRRTFFFIWSAKEAFIKATGAGLSHGLASFAFDLERIPVPPGWQGEETSLYAPVTLRRDRDDPQAAARWTVRTFMPALNFSGALVVEGVVRNLHLRSWDARVGPIGRSE